MSSHTYGISMMINKELIDLLQETYPDNFQTYQEWKEFETQMERKIKRENIVREHGGVPPVTREAMEKRIVQLMRLGANPWAAIIIFLQEERNKAKVPART